MSKLVTLVLLLCGTPSGMRADDMTLEQIGVIRAVLETIIAKDAGLIVSIQTSSPTPHVADFENDQGGLTLASRAEGDRDISVRPDVWQEFKRLNTVSSDLTLLPAISDMAVYSEERLRELLPDAADNSWEHFRREWPHVRGVARVTRPAVSSDGQTALFYASVTRGPLDAEGALYVLHRERDRWVIQTRYVIIAS